MRKLKHCIPVILSLMLLVACQSTQVITVDKVVVPELTFPAFPLAEKITDNKDGTATVPSDWLVLLEEYHIRILQTQNNYEGLKEIYKNFYRSE